MKKMNIKQIKNIVLSIFVLFAILAFTNPPTTYAATSAVGVANYQFLVQQHPDMAQAQKAYNAVIKQARDEFNAKKDDMNDEDQKVLFQQLQSKIKEKQQEIVKPVRDKVDAAIKEVADAKGISIIIDKSVAIYGGQDITDDVMKKIKDA